jgi:hypothetical protein
MIQVYILRINLLPVFVVHLPEELFPSPCWCSSPTRVLIKFVGEEHQRRPECHYFIQFPLTKKVAQAPDFLMAGTIFG